ncbi:hypothetical protein QR680_011808 [Steinernema hermaphroditum]|uniref:Uncharacterized protein n=1 Tax=Steinernema hermaphroditum TaxID=289476 RepID=A0AA39HZT7_9BILA|nr:hypothetical protein QR680_011808 [Steinernema hermaphroditum]
MSFMLGFLGEYTNRYLSVAGISRGHSDDTYVHDKKLHPILEACAIFEEQNAEVLKKQVCFLKAQFTYDCYRQVVDTVYETQDGGALPEPYGRLVALMAIASETSIVIFKQNEGAAASLHSQNIEFANEYFQQRIRSDGQGFWPGENSTGLSFEVAFKQDSLSVAESDVFESTARLKTTSNSTQSRQSLLNFLPVIVSKGAKVRLGAGGCAGVDAKWCGATSSDSGSFAVTLYYQCFASCV